MDQQYVCCAHVFVWYCLHFASKSTLYGITKIPELCK